MGLKESLAKLTMVTIKRGDVLFREGVPSNGAMFFLFEGQLDIYKNLEGKQVKVRSILPGEFFGEMAIINNSPRAASILAVSETAKLGVINRQTFGKMSQESPEFLFLLLKRIIERLFETESRIREVLKEREEAGLPPPAPKSESEGETEDAPEEEGDITEDELPDLEE